MNDLMMQLVNASFQGGVIIAVIFALRFVLKKAPKSILCLLWLLAIARLLLPIQLESSLSLQPDVEIITNNVSQQTQIPSQIPSPQQPAVPMEPIQIGDGEFIKPVYSDAVILPEQSVTIDWAGLLPWLWLAVAAGLALWSILSYWKLRGKTQSAVILRDRVWLSPELDSAFVLGYLKPQIYLPAKLAAEERQLVISHEQAHIRRFDHWYKLLGFIALCVHWFNPLVWAAYIFLCRDMEMACDEQVVRDMDTRQRKAYSMALLRCSADNHHFKPCPVAFAEVSVKDRIKGVLNYKKPGFWMTLVGIVAVVFVAVCFLTNPVNTDNQPPEEVGNLLTTYLDAMKEDMEEAASYHYFSNPTTAWAYKESKDYLTEYEILNWEKLGQGLWVAEVNLKCLSYDDWASYYHFIGKIDGQYCVVYHYDVHATDHFSDDIDLSPYKSTDPNAMIPDDMRQLCFDRLAEFQNSKYLHLYNHFFSNAGSQIWDYTSEYIQADNIFWGQHCYHHADNAKFAYISVVKENDMYECYGVKSYNPLTDESTWVQIEGPDTRSMYGGFAVGIDDQYLDNTTPMEVQWHDNGVDCIFTVNLSSDPTKTQTLTFQFNNAGSLTSMELHDHDEDSETIQTVSIIPGTEPEIQQLADNLLEKVRKHVAYQQQADDFEQELDELQDQYASQQTQP